MYSEMIREISAMPFFNSPAFGIAALVIVGTSWCLVGLVMGDAPKKGVEVTMIQFFGGIVSATVSLMMVLLNGTADPACPRKMLIFTVSMYYLSGFLNFFMLQLMSRAMQRGPNGIIWSIIQSAMVFPFIVGMIFFNTGASATKITGIILLLISLAGFGMAKNNEIKGNGNWKLLAFCALAICAIQQNLATLPTYFPESRMVKSVACSLATASGTVTGSVILTLCTLNREKIEKIKRSFFNPKLWLYVGALQFFGLFFAYTLLYPGMFVMGKHNLGMLCYPMMVGSCIVSFTLSSIFLLKEKIKLIQLAALILCISGLVCLAWQ